MSKIQVTINGQEYIPADQFTTRANQAAKAVIRALISEYYTSVSCHKDGQACKPNCDCGGCHVRRVAVQYLGAEPACQEETDEWFQTIYKATEKQ